jgi:amino acid transporter
MLMLMQVFLLTVFLMLIHSVMASFPTRWIARVNSAGSTFNIIALAIVLIIIPAACDRTAFGLSKFNSNKAVWGDIYEGTDFAPGVSVLMSFVSVICKFLQTHQIQQVRQTVTYTRHLQGQ